MEVYRKIKTQWKQKFITVKQKGEEMYLLNILRVFLST